MSTTNTTDHHGDELNELVRQNALLSRSLLRTLISACRAQEDGAMVYLDNGAHRWGPVITDVAARLCSVRDALTNTANAPSVDWFTPLTSIESLDAALWHQAGAPDEDEDELSAYEVAAVARAVVDMLDVMVGQLAPVAAMASQAPASPGMRQKEARQTTTH